MDAGAHEDENRRHDNFIQVHTTPLNDKRLLKHVKKINTCETTKMKVKHHLDMWGVK